MLQQNFSALEEYAHKLEAEIETLKHTHSIAKTIEHNYSQFAKRTTIDQNKYIPSLEEYVSMKKYKEVADKLIKEKLKNENLKQEIKDLKNLNVHLTNTRQELMQIFETFLDANAVEMQNPTEDALVLPNTVSTIPKSTKTQNILIDSQFKNLEEYAKGYNVLKTCIETSAVFKKIIGEHKERIAFAKKMTL